MTDIITFNVKKPIENSINELVKNLSNDIEKKIREDITNNILSNVTTKSIYGLDDIKDFGKIDEESTVIFKENEYSILRYKGKVTTRGVFSSTGHFITDVYITNIINGLLLSNDDILLLALLSIKYRSTNMHGYVNIGFMPSANFIDFLVQNDYIDVGCQTSFLQNKLDKSLKRYFASVHDNKIKAFEFDKLLEKYKELKETIQTKIEKEYNKLFTIFTETKEELYKTNKENNNLIEELNKLFTVFTESKDENNKTKEGLNKTKEENIKLSDEWLILHLCTFKTPTF
jgi:hypothetical protein